MSLVNELIKGLLPEEEKKKVVAVYGGGFKPPTSGHFEVVQQALKENPEIDEFIILIGGKPRNGITPDESILIWDIYKQYLPYKVEVKYTSVPPIKGIYNYAKEHPDEEVLFIIGAREGNEEDFKDIASRTTSLDKYPNLNLRTIVTTGGVSGTAARNASKISLDKFKNFVPSELSDEEVEEVFNIVANKIQEKKEINTSITIETLLEEEDQLMAEIVNPDGEQFQYEELNIKGLYTYEDSRGNLYFARIFTQPTNPPHFEFKVGWFEDNSINKPKYEPQLPPSAIGIDNLKRRNTIAKIYRDEIIPYFKEKSSISNFLIINPISDLRYTFSKRLVQNWTPKDLNIQYDNENKKFIKINPVQENKPQDGKAAPYGSGYDEVEEGRKKKKDPKKGTGKKPKGSSRRLYTDEDPKDTVGIKFSTRQDIVDTLNKTSFKAKSHARQSQIINLIHQRVRAAYGRAKDPVVKKRLKTGLDYITKRKEASKKKTQRLKKQKTNESVDFISLEKILDDMFEDLGIDINFTRHFKERVIERGLTEEDIIELMKKIYDTHGDEVADLGKDENRVFTHLRRLVDIAAINKGYGEDYLKDLVLKTAYKRNSLREPEFRTNRSSPKLRVNENASYSQQINIIEKIAELTNYMIKKGMNIEPLPSMEFIDGDSENAKDFFGKTAYYDPNRKHIVLYTEGRHPKDIVRSYAHEMIHHIQNLEDRLGDISTTNTQEDDNLNDIEAEANLKGTMTFRNWTDSLNENISPLKNHKVYHSTDSKFEDFSLDYAWDGFWFTDDLDSLKNRTAGASGGKYILTRYITLKNPAGWDEYDKYSIGELIDMGYDGAILPDSGRADYLVFNPKSISKNVDSLNEATVNDKFYPFKVTDRTYDEEDNSLITTEYKFTTPNNTYRVEFYSGEYSPESKTFDLSFGVDRGELNTIDTFQMTGEGNARKILKTILNIVELFINTEDVKKIVVDGTSEKRKRIYKALFSSTSPKISDKIELKEAIVGKKIECDNCGWSWNIVDGGDDLFICHKCGHDNEPISEKKNKDPFGLNAYARELAMGLEENEKVMDYKIYCDMDGVIADFERGYEELTGIDLQGEFKPEGKEFWGPISKAGVGFWAGLKWMPDGQQLWDYIKPFNPQLLSAPSREQSSRIGKHVWVKHKIPGTRLILRYANKKKELASPKSILIDDRQANIDQWEAAGGIGILHTDTNNTIKKLKQLGYE